MNERQVGLVAFFDVLGYKDIIKNNAIEVASNLIEDTLQQAPDDAKKDINRMLASPLQEGDLNKRFLSKIECQLISDSILVYIPLDDYLVQRGDEMTIQDTLDNNGKSNCEVSWVLFFLFCIFLVRTLFNKGLPVRGAIDVGEYYVSNRCFAGKPIIECHLLGEKLDLSGVALTHGVDKLTRMMSNATGKTTTILKDMCVEYLVPLKTGDNKRLNILNWRYALESKIPFDVRKYVYDAFAAHNKDVPASVHSKLLNTELAVRALVAANERAAIAAKQMATTISK